MSWETEDDLFYDLHEDRNLQEVICKVMLPDACSVREYVNGDEDVPVCVDMDHNSWGETFMPHSLGDVQLFP